MAGFVVTGCAGFIGSTLVDSLLDDGHTVTGIDCLTPMYDPELKRAAICEASEHPGFTFLELDLTSDDQRTREAIGAADGVFHLAAQPGVRASWGREFDVYVANNVIGTQRVLEMAGDAATRVVFASSSSIYGNAERHPTPEDTIPEPVSPYGVSKLACEMLCGAYRRSVVSDTVILRYFTVYGPRQRPDMAFARIVEALLDGSSFEVFGDGHQSRDFTYVDDAVAATRAAMDGAPSGAAYNVGGGAEASLRQAIEILEDEAGRRLDAVFTGAAIGDVRRTLAATDRIRADLGWRPRTGLEDGLREQVRRALAWRAASTVAV